MADIRFISSTDTTITIEIYGLEHPIGNYQNFRISVTGWSDYDVSISGTDKSGTHTIENLSPDSSYRIKVEAQPPKGSDFWPVGDAITAYTKPARPVVTNTRVSYTELTDTTYSATVRWSASAVNGIKDQWIYISGPNDTSFSSSAVSAGTNRRSHTFTTDRYGNSIRENTEYSFRVRVQDNNNNLSLLGARGSEATERTPRYVDKIAPTVSDVTGRYQLVNNQRRIVLDWKSSDNVGVTSHEVYIGSAGTANYTKKGVLSGSAKTFTFTSDAVGYNLQPGQTYYMQVIAKDAEGNSSNESDGRFWMKIPYGNPGKWYWNSDYNIGPGSAYYKQSSNGKSAYLMPASVWNNFTDHINDVLLYKNHPAKQFTRARNNKVVTAAVVDEAISAINGMITPASSRMPRIKSGDRINGVIFTEMVRLLNSLVE